MGRELSTFVTRRQSEQSWGLTPQGSLYEHRRAYIPQREFLPFLLNYENIRRPGDGDVWNPPPVRGIGMPSGGIGGGSGGTGGAGGTGGGSGNLSAQDRARIAEAMEQRAAREMDQLDELERLRLLGQGLGWLNRGSMPNMGLINPNLRLNELDRFRLPAPDELPSWMDPRDIQSIIRDPIVGGRYKEIQVFAGYQRFAAGTTGGEMILMYGPPITRRIPIEALMNHMSGDNMMDISQITVFEATNHLYDHMVEVIGLNHFIWRIREVGSNVTQDVFTQGNYVQLVFSSAGDFEVEVFQRARVTRADRTIMNIRTKWIWHHPDLGPIVIHNVEHGTRTEDINHRFRYPNGNTAVNFGDGSNPAFSLGRGEEWVPRNTVPLTVLPRDVGRVFVATPTGIVTMGGNIHTTERVDPTLR